jgi:hypothetical protein
MDQIDPRTHVIHEPIEGENLRKQRIAADQPFPRTPWELGKLLALIAILGLIWFALCAMQFEALV